MFCGYFTSFLSVGIDTRTEIDQMKISDSIMYANKVRLSMDVR